MIKRILLIALSMALFLPPALADTIVKPGGQGPTGITALTINIPAVSTVVNLVAESNYISIVNASATATLYFSPVSPASTSGPSTLVPPGYTLTYHGASLTKFWVVGDSATGKFGVLAN